MNIRIELEKVDVNPGRISRKIMGNTRFWTYAATQWHRLYTPYVPMDTGTMTNTVSITPGQIEHTAPYAHYQYNGTRFNFRRDRHPKACAEWDKRAEATQGPRLISTLQAFIDRGGINFDE